MSLVELNIPSPDSLRGGWAALSAVCAAQGWNDVRASNDQWFYHDGGGNWASLKFDKKGRAVLIGHDHEYSETYYGAAAKYFQEEETDLLSEAPDWWSFDLDPAPFGEWIGFIYGWDGEKWKRADYQTNDGFDDVGLLRACSMSDTEHLKEFAMKAPGLQGDPSRKALEKLVQLDAHITSEALEAVVPGWDIPAGVEAARKFLLREARQ